MTDKCWGGKRLDNKLADAKQDHANVACNPQKDKPVASTSYVTLGDNNHIFTFYPWILDSATHHILLT